METNKCCSKCVIRCRCPKPSSHPGHEDRCTNPSCPCHKQPEGLEKLLVEWKTELRKIWYEAVLDKKTGKANLHYELMEKYSSKFFEEALAQAYNLGKMEERERVKKLVEEERKRFIEIFERRNIRKDELEIERDKNWEGFDFNIFANNLTDSLTEGGENGNL